MEEQRVASGAGENPFHPFMDDPEKFEQGLREADAAINSASSQYELVRAKSAAIWFLTNLERDLDRALTLSSEIISEYRAGCDPEISPYVAAALNNRGWLLAWKNSDFEGALQVFDEAFETFAKSSEPLVAGKAMGARVNKGWLLFELERYDEALEIFDALIAALKERSHLAFRSQLANSLINKALLLQKLGRSEEAHRLAVDVLTDFSRGDSYEFEEAIDTAADLLRGAFSAAE